MRRTFLSLVLVILLTPLFTAYVFAQTVSSTPSTSPQNSDNHTAREEAEGKAIFDGLQAKQITCDKLSIENFGALGEYYMGQMTGSSHETMNTMMEQMMGKDGEEQMHSVMGKKLSGCDTTAQLPSQGYGFMPIMWMMQGGGNSMMGTGWSNMMSGWNGFGILGWLPMLLFWILLILGVVALLRYLVRSGQHDNGKTPFEILKERYARGEIDKKEFEDRKKDLS